MRRRRLTALAVLVAAAALGARFALAEADATPATRTPAPPSSGSGSIATTAPCAPPRVASPRWYRARRATLVVDSVLLGGVPAVKANLAGWKVLQRGRPAVMLRAIAGEIAAAPARIAPLAVVGLGYNSLWQPDRVRYAIWAAAFDRDAQRLIAALKRRGAEQIVWVTLRQARRAVIPSNSLWQHDDYAWYFPYVNERLRRLDRLRGDLALADWAKVSNRPGVTYDAIHLNPAGQRLMARTIRSAIEQEAVRQVTQARGRLPRSGCQRRSLRPSS